MNGVFGVLATTLVLFIYLASIFLMRYQYRGELMPDPGRLLYPQGLPERQHNDIIVFL